MSLGSFAFSSSTPFAAGTRCGCRGVLRAVRRPIGQRSERLDRNFHACLSVVVANSPGPPAKAGTHVSNWPRREHVIRLRGRGPRLRRAALDRTVVFPAEARPELPKSFLRLRPALPLRLPQLVAPAQRYAEHATPPSEEKCHCARRARRDGGHLAPALHHWALPRR